MTKKKKETTVKNKVSNGRVTKAKNSELAPVTPFTRKIQEKVTGGRLGPRKAEKSSSKIPAAMPFPSGNMSKCTSTPMTGQPVTKENNFKHVSRSGRLAKPNLKFAQFFGGFAVKALPSPILADIGNRNTNRTRDIDKIKKLSITDKTRNNKQSNESKENAKRTRTESKKTTKNLSEPKRVKVSNENRPRSTSSSTSPERSYTNRSSSVRVLLSRSPTIKNMVSKVSIQDPFLSTITHRRRRSVGLRKVETNEGKSTLEKRNNLLVRVNRSPSIREMLAANETTYSISDRRNKTGDNSMFKRLQADWSSSTFEQTPSKFAEDTMGNAFQKYTPLRAGKRRLSPLIEITCCEDSVCSEKPLRTSRINIDDEDGYSSSAEFETDNEVEKNRSKRAPTWKDLLNKTVESVSSLKISTPGKDVPQRRSQAKHSVLNRTGENGGKNIKMSLEESKDVERQNQSNETVTENPVSPSSRSQNLLNNSDLIEQILSSSNINDDVENIPTNFSTANSTTTKKFFHSRQEKSIVDPKPAEVPKPTRTSGRKRKRDSVYEFLSQSSSDDVDPVADVIQKMIKTGKVTVAKLKKGTGKMVLPKQKRRKVTKKTTSQIENNVQSKPLTRQHPLKETNVVTFNDQLQYEDDGFFDDEPRVDQGGFSELARSAMIKQASKSHQTPQRKPLQNKGELLAMVQKIVGQSTPNRTFLAPASTSQFSPILGSSSPWRVDDNSLPKPFYFSRNSDNLPSFSSDHIPSTPVKNKSKSKSLSSFSSNDSDMENMPPPSIKVTANENQTQNTLNVRRALSYRSPLKTINIIDVVHLPPLAMNKVANISENNTSNNTANYTSNNAANNTANNTANKTANKTSEENTNKDKSSKSADFGLFGFDEDMSDTEDDNVNVTETVSRKQYLKEEMQRLRRLRPQIPPTTTAKKNNYRIKPVFDDERRRQLTMKQLCSTMIEKQQSELAYDNSQDENMNSPVDLFKDSKPETTFNQEQPRRSYSRRHGRSHRNYFIDYPSEDEDGEEYKLKPKKRRRRDPKEEERKAELNRFADEFNKMCQEVSEYEIMVE